MFAFAAWIIEAAGWRRCLIAFAAGAAGALAMAPFDIWPALAIPMTVAVWLIDGSCDRAPKKATGGLSVRHWRRFDLGVAGRRAFAAGWWWGFGYFVAGLWWLGAAFLTDGGKYIYIMPLGVIGLPAVMALYPAFGFMLARLVWTPGPARVLVFAAALTLTEWLRGNLFTGFPWNAFGMALGGNLAAAQLASIIGLYGLTLVAILIFSAPATLAGKPLSARAIAPSGAAAIALAAIFAFGALRLAHAKDAFVAGVALKIMQPNLAQDDKYRPEYKDEILAGYLKLSDLAKDADSTDVTVVIWPESAFPFILSRDAEAVAEIAAALPLGSFLVTGAARAEEDPASPAGGLGLPSSQIAHPIFFNAIQVIASSGVILDTYDKAHLVPFGEYLPFESILSRAGLHHFVHIPGGFEAGSRRRTLNVPGLPPVAPLICYEAIFPGEALPQEQGAPRPGLMLNVTDDGWFGLTAGPYQHFAEARLRAIEEGLPLARAANTGISAIIDPYGRILEQLPLGAAGLLKGSLPQPITAPAFARAPFLMAFLPWLAVVAAAAAALWLRRVRPWRL
ncbi:apolipoprotein N-acyltransferase [Methylocella sp.]|jgi:apolipoprotein N-acyltransferase|uniref:apolipoprotein N-acyltransferase n=1 Tax=Methylocella sp. TaxID=1978226 RepID=UPI003C274F38